MMLTRIAMPPVRPIRKSIQDRRGNWILCDVKVRRAVHSCSAPFRLIGSAQSSLVRRDQPSNNIFSRTTSFQLSGPRLANKSRSDIGPASGLAVDIGPYPIPKRAIVEVLHRPPRLASDVLSALRLYSHLHSMTRINVSGCPIAMRTRIIR
ncbi:hypothetical protein EVAR_97185_1 [Eumeta japonica]|uniref:Uncharacterized protein n=1 Tax=Eumeta variegata TaxID=151549 RepID=A0A4C1WJ98_EUMVA|nr:hypothetical protein EVAR_97185_1 [Eumeta japonica]